jgi:protein-L-isoaspartate O-methyltransferase
MSPDPAHLRYREFEHAAWERAAANYANSFETVTALFARPLLDAVACDVDLQVLDVACGSGYISSLAASIGAKPIGVDFSAGMVAQSRKQYPLISFAEADAESLPFPDGSFDRVVIGFGVHHFPNPPLAIAEAHRVLRTGGRLAFTVWSATDHALQHLLLDAIRQGGVAGSSLPVPPQGEVNDGQCCLGLLRGAGFDFGSTSVQKLEKLVVVESAARLIEVMLKGTARSSALIRAQPPDALPSVIAALDVALQAYMAGTVFKVPAVAILALGTR